MKSFVIAFSCVVLLVALPGAAQDWERQWNEVQGQAREAMEQARAHIADAMRRVSEVDPEELRETSQRALAEMGEQVERAQAWAREVAERAQAMHREAMERWEREAAEAREREEMERREREEMERRPPEDPGMLGKTLRLTFEYPEGHLSILTATRNFEGGGSRHRAEGKVKEGEKHGDRGGEGSFEVGGEVIALDEPARYLVRYQGHYERNMHEEEGAPREGETRHGTEGGNAHFQGSAILSLGGSCTVLSVPELEVRLVLEEGDVS